MTWALYRRNPIRKRDCSEDSDISCGRVMQSCGETSRTEERFTIWEKENHNARVQCCGRAEERHSDSLISPKSTDFYAVKLLSNDEAVNKKFTDDIVRRAATDHHCDLVPAVLHALLSLLRLYGRYAQGAWLCQTDLAGHRIPDGHCLPGCPDCRSGSAVHDVSNH